MIRNRKSRGNKRVTAALPRTLRLKETWPTGHHLERLDQAPIVQEMPVLSLVCNPPQNSLIGMNGTTDITVKGVAWSGGGRKVERVDVSIDGGKTWTAAELYKPIELRRNRHWAWTQFSKTLPLPEDVRLDITSKAMNSDFKKLARG